MKRYTDHRDATAKLLAEVEGELRQVDAADDQIGAHAEDAHRKLLGELARRRGSGVGDAKTQDEYLYLLRHQRQARQVAELSATARRRRGGG